jgi:hypothetical protein
MIDNTVYNLFCTKLNKPEYYIVMQKSFPPICCPCIILFSGFPQREFVAANNISAVCALS